LNSTAACSTKISGEHLISESVLRVLADEQIELSGVPWLNGQKKVLRFGALTSNCLCTSHNTALSPIDAAGGRFFSAVQQCGTTQVGPNQEFLLSGHDVERWMLRTLAALGVSRNLAVDGARIDANLVQRLNITELLEKPAGWRKPLGLYLMRGLGHQFTRRDSFRLAPLLQKDSDIIVGMITDVQGLELGLVAAEHDIREKGFEKALYRPSSFVFKIGRLSHTLRLSWEDGHEHLDVIVTSYGA
jgi:hypothetical protein